jgi:ATP-dependent helicase HrpB
MSLPDLPISPVLPEIARRLAAGHLVLSAPPGSGKTTLVPLALLDAPWLADQKIVILEPRRPAARMAAHRMAGLLGEKVGETIGYQVRFERRIGPRTRIEVLTEGLLLRRLQADPELSDTGLVIFDEFHERSLSGDLSLSLCLDASALREDLRLMPMSASLDGAGLAELLGAEHIEAKGRSHPVQIHHLTRDPAPDERLRRLAGLVRQALDRHQGDLLVFLPGKGEIRRLHDLLEAALAADIRLCALHGEIPAAEQDAIIRGEGDGRRVILATDIAETSLTIEGIGVVIDSGLNRKPRFDPCTGLSRLHTGFISQASALQRAGRAGRLGPGHCYRAWSEARQQRLEPRIRPEILDADLAPMMLELAGWGVNDPAQLRWITPPPAAQVEQGKALLRQLAAIDAAGLITPNGQAMLRLPTHPRLAHLLVAAGSTGDRQLSADIAALLGERDPARQTNDSDIRTRLTALQAYRRGAQPAGFDTGALRRIDAAARQLLRLSPDRAEACGTRSPGAALALAFPDRIGRARAPGSPDYLLRNGRAASLRPHDGLVGAPFLVAAALDAGSEQGRIWLAAPIAQEEIEDLFADQIERQREVEWDETAGAARVWQRERLGALVLTQRNVPIQPQDDVPGLLLKQVRRHGLTLFGNIAPLRQLQGKLALLHRHDPESDWPDITDPALLASLDAWLAPWLDGISTLKQLRAVDIVAAVESLLGWERRQRLMELLPDSYQTPAGTRRPIEYPPDGEPILRAPLQEMLGEADTPRIAHGRIPLTLHLLSPAMRPLQITRDLAHFWVNTYTEVRKEMRGRYPKHHWPEDPLTARACRLGRRRD